MQPYYEHAGITIYHADCRECLSLYAYADAMITDPPYGIAWNRGLNVQRWSKSQAGIFGDEDTSVRDAILEAWLPKPAIVFGSDLAVPPDGKRHTLYWQKPPDAGVYGSYTGFRRDVELIFLCGDIPRRPPEWSSVLVSSAASVGNPSSPSGRYQHPHAKPLDLLMRLVDLLASVVVDPFMGSGTTLDAARRLGRRAIGIEIEERHCAVAAERLSQELLPLACADAADVV